MDKHFRLIVAFLIIILSVSYLYLTKFYQNYYYESACRQLEDHAKVISNSLWRYETKEPFAYLKLASISGNYKKLVVTDDTGRIFAKYETEVDGFDLILSKAGLLPEYTIERPVLHNNLNIGNIKVIWISKAFYLFFYLFLFFVLLFLVILFFLNLVVAKKELEYRVAARTADLNKKSEELKASEERLNLALKGANDGIWDWNMTNDEIHFDARYYKMAGYEPYEFPGSFKEWEKRVHPEDLKKTLKAIDEYINNRTSLYDVQFRFLKKDGEYMWIRGKGKIASRDENNEPLRFIGTHSDITERMETEKELKQLRNYLSNIIDSMPSVLIGVNIDGEITQWNKHAEITTGIQSDKALGRPLEQVYPKLSDEKNNVCDAIRQRKKMVKKKKEIITDDDLRFEDVTIYPLIADGIDGAVLRVDDVTDQVRIEEMMVQSEKMLSVGGLAAGMAHEINNPLAGMIQTANVMKSRLEDINMSANLKAAEDIGVQIESIRSFMEKRGILRMLNAINESGKRAAEIVENMLSFARKSNSHISMHDPVTLLDQILELATTDYDLKKNYDFKRIKILKEYEENVPLINCEGAKVQQVLLNILRNGAQAMQEDANPCFVLRISHESDKKMVRFEIEDNGPGISKEVQNRIFEPFFTTKPPGLGTGLGLSVSYFIITENHGGTLEVQSAEGNGANFIIRLPVNSHNNKNGA